MKPLDKNYLSLQFKIKIYSLNGTEFQSFFENIMEKAFLDFQKTRPYGNEGDAGNDGYRKDSGIYYQVYAPNTPKANESKAAKKLQNDFQKLQNEWNKISKIKEYNFVFNDKYGGSVQFLEAATSNLKANNPSIEFKFLLAKDLENVFFQLSETDILGLGFNIDQRQAISIAYTHLESVKTELDRENARSAQNNLENVKDIISALGDENLSLEYEILECRCLQKFEKVDEAKGKYDNISKRFPKDSRPLLYLAEIFLNDKNFDKNSELLEKAEKIGSNYWLLNLEQMVRKSHLREKIDTKNVDEKTFPVDPNVKANFYRLYGLFFEDSGDQIKADSFIEKAIHLNPDRLSNYIAKLSLIENRLFASQDASQRLHISQGLLDETEKVERKFFEYGDVGARNKAILNSKKLIALFAQENIPEFVSVSKETFELLITCYFDVQIEQIILGVLRFISLPDNELNRLLEYLKNSKKVISEELSKVLVAQFNIRNTLFTEGKIFFEEIHNQRYLEFISDLENNNYEKVLVFLKPDIEFAITIANTLKSSPDLRKKIIENLPDEKNIQKEKLWLLLKFDEKDFDKAFQILKQLDLSNLNYIECRPMLQIIQQKEAWDFEIIILEKLIEKERNEKEKFNLKSQLFNAHLNLKKFPEVIDIGEQLLKEDAAKNLLNPSNKEALLTNTIFACFERGKVDNEAFKKAKEIFGKYRLANPSFEFKAGVEAEIYLNNNEVENALKAVIEGVKIKKSFTPQEYARLHFLFLKTGNQIDLNLDSLYKVQENTFVKLSNKDQWYFIGHDNELDALPIAETNNKYSSFIDKKLGDKVVFENKYGSGKLEEDIEIIYSIEKYILWQTFQNFHKLSKDGDLEWAQMIEIPQKEDTVNLQNLLKLFEDLNTKKEPLFEMYCKNNVPLAVLAVSEGGLTNAIGRIQHENKGFIHFSVGTPEEFEKQKEIAKKVIDTKMPFYIDGTSAIVLSETGLFQKIHAHLPNLKVPQSVINLLANITDRFRYTAGQPGHIGYAQGRITFSSIEKDKRDLIRSNFIASIKLLESNPKNIGIISSANKTDCFSEKEIPDELSDACILAQKENLPILTEDFLYLKMNELETNKKVPEYFSSLALLRSLYEENQVSFNEYLEYFGYLSSYRFRFLTLNSDDIEKAVFGDGDIKTVNPENIRKLNFPFTLSEEYGVPFQMAFTVVGRFLLKVLMDNTVTLDIAEKIFIEIIVSFPTKMNKKNLVQMFLGVCVRAIENNKSKFVLQPKAQLIYEKVDKLLRATEIYNSESKLWTPN